MDIGLLDAKGKDKDKHKGKAKDKPDAEMACYYCGKVGHREADCWSWQAAQKEKEKEKPSAKKDATPKKGAKKDVAAVDVGSLAVGALSACASDSWVLSVEVTEIDETWTTHTMRTGDGGLWRRRPSLPVDYAPEFEVEQGSVKLPFIGAGGDRIEHIGQKTVGYATRDGADVEIAYEAAKVRRPLFSADGLVEKGQVTVCTDCGGLIIPRSALQVDPPLGKLSTKRKIGHFWLPLVRRIETSVNLVMVAPMEGAAEEQDIDEKMDEELPVEERSAGVVRKPGEEFFVHEGTHLPFRDWCPPCVSCSPSDPAHRLTERAEGEPPMVQIDRQFASEKTNMEVSAKQVVTAGPMVTIFMATCCGRGAVAATQCSKGAIANLAAFFTDQLAAWSVGSGTLVLRADQETSHTPLLDEIKARRAETLVERTAVESHQPIGAVERMNREVAGLPRTLKATLDARISGKVALDHDLIRWMFTRFRVVWSGKVEGSDDHITHRSGPTDVRRRGKSWRSTGRAKRRCKIWRTNRGGMRS